VLRREKEIIVTTEDDFIEFMKRRGYDTVTLIKRLWR